MPIKSIAGKLVRVQARGKSFEDPKGWIGPALWGAGASLAASLAAQAFVYVCFTSPLQIDTLQSQLKRQEFRFRAATGNTQLLSELIARHQQSGVSCLDTAQRVVTGLQISSFENESVVIRNCLDEDVEMHGKILAHRNDPFVGKFFGTLEIQLSSEIPVYQRLQQSFNISRKSVRLASEELERSREAVSSFSEMSRDIPNAVEEFLSDQEYESAGYTAKIRDLKRSPRWAEAYIVLLIIAVNILLNRRGRAAVVRITQVWFDR